MDDRSDTQACYYIVAIVWAWPASPTGKSEDSYTLHECD